MQPSLANWIFLCCLLSAKLTAQFQIGPSVTYLQNPSTVGFGISSSFPVSGDQYFGSVSAHYLLRDKLKWETNFDLQYQLVEINYKTVIRPLAGLHFHGETVSPDGNKLNFGIQTGLFLQTPINDGLDFFFEAKYLLLLKSMNGLSFRSGVYF